MTQTSNRFYDRFAQLMNDASSVAQGVRREATTMFRSQAERMATDMDLVKREDFEAVKEMAQKAREENTRLEKRIAELEAKLGITPAKSSASASTRSSGSSARSASSGKSTAGRSSSGGTTGTAKPRTTRSRTTKAASGTASSSGAASSSASETPAGDTTDESKA